MSKHQFHAFPADSAKPFAVDLLVLGENYAMTHCLGLGAEDYRLRLIPVQTAAAALNLLTQRAIAAVLIHVNTLGPDAYRICAEIRHKSLVTIVMLSADKCAEELVKSFEAGADHYLVMPFAQQELLARIAATQRRMKREDALSYYIVQGDIALNPVKQEVRINDMLVELTTNEYRLLQYLVRNPNRAIRTEDLLHLVWGYGSKDDLSVVRTTIHRLRHKIEKNPNTPKYVKTIFGLGYRLCIQQQI